MPKRSHRAAIPLPPLPPLSRRLRDRYGALALAEAEAVPGGAWGAAGRLKQPAPPWLHSTTRVKGEVPCSSLTLGAVAPPTPRGWFNVPLPAPMASGCPRKAGGSSCGSPQRQASVGMARTDEGHLSGCLRQAPVPWPLSTALRKKSWLRGGTRASPAAQAELGLGRRGLTAPWCAAAAATKLAFCCPNGNQFPSLAFCFPLTRPGSG